MRCNESPDNAPERHACRKNHLIDTEGASLDPTWRGNLDGKIERGHGAGPGKPCEQQYRDDHKRVMGESKDEQCPDEYDGRNGNNRIGWEFSPEPRQRGGSNDGSEPHAAIQDAVSQRALMQVTSGHDCQEGPDRANEYREKEDAYQGSL